MTINFWTCLLAHNSIEWNIGSASSWKGLGTDRDNSEVSDRLFQLDLGSYSQRKYCGTKS